MNAPAPFLGPGGTNAVTDADTSPRRSHLTSRGEYVVAAAVTAALFLLLWAASALAYLVCGVAG